MQKQSPQRQRKIKSDVPQETGTKMVDTSNIEGTRNTQPALNPMIPDLKQNKAKEGVTKSDIKFTQ